MAKSSFIALLISFLILSMPFAYATACVEIQGAKGIGTNQDIIQIEFVSKLREIVPDITSDQIDQVAKQEFQEEYSPLANIIRDEIIQAVKLREIGADLIAQGLEKPITLNQLYDKLLQNEEAYAQPIPTGASAHYTPSDTFKNKKVGGDHFSITEENGILKIVLFDLMGHGIDAASSKYALTKFLEEQSGAEIENLVENINLNMLTLFNKLGSLTGRKEFAQASYLELNTKTGELRFANMGNEFYIQRAGGSLEIIGATSAAAGVLESAPKVKTMQLQEGDKIILLSDGITESKKETLEEFGIERLEGVIRANAGATAEDLQKAIAQAANNFRQGAEQTDDMTVLVIKPSIEEVIPEILSDQVKDYAISEIKGMQIYMETTPLRELKPKQVIRTRNRIRTALQATPSLQQAVEEILNLAASKQKPELLEKLTIEITDKSDNIKNLVNALKELKAEEEFEIKIPEAPPKVSELERRVQDIKDLEPKPHPEYASQKDLEAIIGKPIEFKGLAPVVLEEEIMAVVGIIPGGEGVTEAPQRAAAYEKNYLDIDANPQTARAVEEHFIRTQSFKTLNRIFEVDPFEGTVLRDQKGIPIYRPGVTYKNGVYSIEGPIEGLIERIPVGGGLFVRDSQGKEYVMLSIVDEEAVNRKGGEFAEYLNVQLGEGRKATQEDAQMLLNFLRDGGRRSLLEFNIHKKLGFIPKGLEARIEEIELEDGSKNTVLLIPKMPLISEAEAQKRRPENYQDKLEVLTMLRILLGNYDGGNNIQPVLLEDGTLAPAPFDFDSFGPIYGIDQITKLSPEELKEGKRSTSIHNLALPKEILTALSDKANYAKNLRQLRQNGYKAVALLRELAEQHGGMEKLLRSLGYTAEEAKLLSRSLDSTVKTEKVDFILDGFDTEEGVHISGLAQAIQKSPFVYENSRAFIASSLPRNFDPVFNELSIDPQPMVPGVENNPELIAAQNFIKDANDNLPADRQIEAIQITEFDTILVRINRGLDEKGQPIFESLPLQQLADAETTRRFGDTDIIIRRKDTTIGFEEIRPQELQRKTKTELTIEQERRFLGSRRLAQFFGLENERIATVDADYLKELPIPEEVIPEAVSEEILVEEIPEYIPPSNEEEAIARLLTGEGRLYHRLRRVDDFDAVREQGFKAESNMVTVKDKDYYPAFFVPIPFSEPLERDTYVEIEGLKLADGRKTGKEYLKIYKELKEKLGREPSVLEGPFDEHYIAAGYDGVIVESKTKLVPIPGKTEVVIFDGVSLKEKVKRVIVPEAELFLAKLKAEGKITKYGPTLTKEAAKPVGPIQVVLTDPTVDNILGGLAAGIPSGLAGMVMGMSHPVLNPIIGGIGGFVGGALVGITLQKEPKLPEKVQTEKQLLNGYLYQLNLLKRKSFFETISDSVKRLSRRTPAEILEDAIDAKNIPVLVAIATDPKLVAIATDTKVDPSLRQKAHSLIQLALTSITNLDTEEAIPALQAIILNPLMTNPELKILSPEEYKQTIDIRKAAMQQLRIIATSPESAAKAAYTFYDTLTTDENQEIRAKAKSALLNKKFLDNLKQSDFSKSFIASLTTNRQEFSMLTIEREGRQVPVFDVIIEAYEEVAVEEEVAAIPTSVEKPEIISEEPLPQYSIGNVQALGEVTSAPEVTAANVRLSAGRLEVPELQDAVLERRRTPQQIFKELQEQGLQPKHKFTVKGKVAYASDTFIIPELGNRIGSILYIQRKDGQFDIRLALGSESHDVVRVASGLTVKGEEREPRWIGKGLDEFSMSLKTGMSLYLQSLEPKTLQERGAVLEIPTQLDREKVGSMKHLAYEASLVGEEVIIPRDPFAFPDASPIDPTATGNPSLKEIKDDQDAPDYSKVLSDTTRKSARYQGTMRTVVVPSKNGEYLYTFKHVPEKDISFLGVMEVADTDMTEYGVNKQRIDMKGVAEPGIDYFGQAKNEEGEASALYPFDKTYYYNTEYTHNLPVVKAFREQFLGIIQETPEVEKAVSAHEAVAPETQITIAGITQTLKVGEPLTIGRHPDNYIVVKEVQGAALVSREHATITLKQDGTITIKDLNSANGILVEGSLITSGKEVLVKPTDTIVLGGKDGVGLQIKQEAVEEKPIEVEEISTPESISEAQLENAIQDLDVKSGRHVEVVKGARRIIAMGDIHGELDGLLDNMIAANVIDENDNLILRKGEVLVFDGDYVDRGGQNVEVIQFLIDLKKEAESRGARVVTNMGNHDYAFARVFQEYDELRSQGYNEQKSIEFSEDQRKVLFEGFETGIKRLRRAEEDAPESEKAALTEAIEAIERFRDKIREGGVEADFIGKVALMAATTGFSPVTLVDVMNTAEQFFTEYKSVEAMEEVREFFSNLKQMSIIDNNVFVHGSIPGEIRKAEPKTLEELEKMYDQIYGNSDSIREEAYRYVSQWKNQKDHAEARQLLFQLIEDTQGIRPNKVLVGHDVQNKIGRSKEHPEIFSLDAGLTYYYRRSGTTPGILEIRADGKMIVHQPLGEEKKRSLQTPGELANPAQVLDSPNARLQRAFENVVKQAPLADQLKRLLKTTRTKKSPILIGRDPVNDVLSTDNTVSRKHAIIYVEIGEWFIEDTQSSRGVLVNNEKIETPRKIISGDTITIGDQQFTIPELPEIEEGEPTKILPAIKPEPVLASRTLNVVATVSLAIPVAGWASIGGIFVWDAIQAGPQETFGARLSIALEKRWPRTARFGQSVARFFRTDITQAEIQQEVITKPDGTVEASNKLTNKLEDITGRSAEVLAEEVEKRTPKKDDDCRKGSIRCNRAVESEVEVALEDMVNNDFLTEVIGMHPITGERPTSNLYKRLTKDNLDDIFQLRLPKLDPNFGPEAEIYGAKAVVYRNDNNELVVAFLSESEATHHIHALAKLAERDDVEAADAFYMGDLSRSAYLLDRAAGFEFQYDKTTGKIVSIVQDSWITKRQIDRNIKIDQEDFTLAMFERIPNEFLDEKYQDSNWIEDERILLAALQKPTERAPIQEVLEDVPTPEGVPEPRDISVLDREKAEEWINEPDDPDIQDVKQKIIDNVRRISFSEFKRSVKEVAEAVNDEIEGQPYAVIWDSEPHKSRRWVYHLAMDHIQNKPVSTIYDSTDSIREQIDKGVDRFVIFDDGSFSGAQIESTVLHVKKQWENAGRQGKPTIIIAVPFISSTALKRINEINPEVNVKVISSEGITLTNQEKVEDPKGNMPTIYEALPDVIPQLLTPLAISGDKTLTYFDHHIPDPFSFPSEIASLLRDFEQKSPYDYEDTEYYKEEARAFEKPMTTAEIQQEAPTLIESMGKVVAET